MKPIVFRPDAIERAAGEARAARDGVSIGEVARRGYRAFLGLPLAIPLGGRQLRVEYDPVE